MIAGIVAVIAGIVIYGTIDPLESRWMPKCFFHEMTGWECAGCGAQRLFHALLTGNVREAFHHNPFLFCMLPLLCFMVWLETVRLRHSRLYAAFYRPAVCYALCALVAGWTILRNIL